MLSLIQDHKDQVVGTADQSVKSTRRSINPCAVMPAIASTLILMSANALRIVLLGGI